jgi:NO-binding membrane sensor protein with MHYT domain
MADSLTISWCPETIILSFFMSFFGAYAGINLCEQSRLTSELNSSRILHHRMPKILIACCIGGVSIWTMHFLGIAAMMLSNPVTGERINKTFTIDYTLISLAAVVVMCYLGILICSRDPVFSIQKVETLDTFIGDTSNMTIGELKNQHFRTKLIYMRLGKGTGSLIIGGLLTGAGICVMHYIGMYNCIGVTIFVLISMTILVF